MAKKYKRGYFRIVKSRFKYFFRNRNELLIALILLSLFLSSSFIFFTDFKGKINKNFGEHSQQYLNDEISVYNNKILFSGNFLTKKIIALSTRESKAADNLLLTIQSALVPPLLNFTSHIPLNGTTAANTSVQINIPNIEQNINEVKYSWNATASLTNASYTHYTSGKAIDKVNGLAVIGAGIIKTGMILDTGLISGAMIDSTLLEIMATLPTIQFGANTPANDANITVNSTLINITVSVDSPLTKFTWDWNGTNYTLYNNSLRLFYNFDNLSALGESSTVVLDLSNSSSNGTLTGKPVFTTGVYNGAYIFNGTTDYIATNKLLSAFFRKQNYTISIWAKPTAALKPSNANVYNLPGIIGDSSGYMGINIGNRSGTTGIWVFNWDGNEDAVSVNYTADQWIHIVRVQNATNLLIYKNGLLANSTLTGGTLTIENGNLNVGYAYGGYFNGTLDQAMVFNRVLSADEIAELYKMSLTKMNSTDWEYSANESSLVIGMYTYYGCAANSVGEQCTALRNISVVTLSTADTTPPSINFTSPTLANGTSTASTSIQINISILNASDLGEMKWNWNGTNYTIYDNTTVLHLNFDNISNLGEQHAQPGMPVDGMAERTNLMEAMM
ncbi:LamG domain-containing protein [Candidatus Woesearchaeota archaeon]|nr:LamG domain-containing protein [Candidatus Woesearchaeota archaeon]